MGKIKIMRVLQFWTLIFLVDLNMLRRSHCLVIFGQEMQLPGRVQDLLRQNQLKLYLKQIQQLQSFIDKQTSSAKFEGQIEDEIVAKGNRGPRRKFQNRRKFLKDKCDEYTYIDPMCQGGGPQIHPLRERDQDSREFPYIISLQAQSPFNNKCFLHICGGTLIAPDIVLGPAHCFELLDLEDVPLFAAQAPKCRNEPGLKRVEVSKLVLKEDFDPASFENDLAILFLNSSLPGPVIDIASSPLIKLETNSIVGFVGYGLDENDFDPGNDYEKVPLQGGFNIEFRPNETCPIPLSINDTKQICTSTFPFNDNGCIGDSGGPLLFLRGKRPVQIGLLSYIFEFDEFACNNGNAVYAKVATYLDWISKTSGIDFVNSPQPPIAIASAPPPPPPPPPAPTQIDSQDIQFLRIINELREEACSGYPLRWDFHLALEASVIVNRCVGFSSTVDRITVYFNSNLNSSNSIEEVVRESFGSSTSRRRLITSQFVLKVGCDISYDCKFRQGNKFVLYACAFDRITPDDAEIPSCPEKTSKKNRNKKKSSKNKGNKNKRRRSP